MNLIQTIEAENIAKFLETKTIPDFRPGDTLKVGVKVVEGERTRVQNYEGVCIARSNKGMGSNFTVRKISFGEGVERVFPLYSPNIDSIEVVRKGVVRRAKLYYLRGLRGKRARIAERRDHAQPRAAPPPNKPSGSSRLSVIETPCPALSGAAFFVLVGACLSRCISNIMHWSIGGCRDDGRNNRQDDRARRCAAPCDHGHSARGCDPRHSLHEHQRYGAITQRLVRRYPSSRMGTR